MSSAGLLAFIGGLVVVYQLVKLAWRCWCGFRQFVLSAFWQVDLRSYGKWAVVTGATSGIGKAYATELARRGLDIVLVSRCRNKLQAVAKEIEDRFGRETRTIQVDFTEGQSIYPVVAEQLEGLEVGILVNNVGMMYCTCFAYFLQVPDAEQKITQIVNCNMLSVPQMTRLVLPGMLERGTGLIINMSSEAGVHPQPLLSLYSSTKCVAPFLVSTSMTSLEVSRVVKSASEFAHEALNTVGHSTSTSGCLSHALQDLILSLLLPDWLRTSSFFLRQLTRIGRRAKACRGKKE
ncbi:Very-long-chain 3-oxoacyl-CoA reductase [Takifugu flavidus]|uniref:Very-long-chain 3-oxoacyl-CoA reductase n=1 Tax=Takifugu flavidus TaxID=433684 RepID=A0A5C6P7A2_9TELE|nr:Very-long-chain 3-oxoacyl-CoA reductase [Takifugu flavidus]